MGKTIIEKIISNHSTDENIKPGEIVWMDLDVRSARDFGGPNVVKHLQKHYPENNFVQKENLYFTFDIDPYPGKPFFVNFRVNPQVSSQRFSRVDHVSLQGQVYAIPVQIVSDPVKVNAGCL